MFLLIVESDFYLLLHLFIDFYKQEFGTFSHGCLPIVFTYKHGQGGGVLFVIQGVPKMVGSFKLE